MRGGAVAGQANGQWWGGRRGGYPLRHQAHSAATPEGGGVVKDAGRERGVRKGAQQPRSDRRKRKGTLEEQKDLIRKKVFSKLLKKSIKARREI